MKSGSAVTVTVRPEDEGRVTAILAEHQQVWTRTAGRVGSAEGYVDVVVLRITVQVMRGTSPLVRDVQALRDEVWMLLDVTNISL